MLDPSSRLIVSLAFAALVAACGSGAPAPTDAGTGRPDAGADAGQPWDAGRNIGVSVGVTPDAYSGVAASTEVWVGRTDLDFDAGVYGSCVRTWRFGGDTCCPPPFADVGAMTVTDGSWVASFDGPDSGYAFFDATIPPADAGALITWTAAGGPDAPAFRLSSVLPSSLHIDSPVFSEDAGGLELDGGEDLFVSWSGASVGEVQLTPSWSEGSRSQNRITCTADPAAGRFGIPAAAFSDLSYPYEMLFSVATVTRASTRLGAVPIQLEAVMNAKLESPYLVIPVRVRPPP